jgi:putative oxidoreductase
MKSFAKSIFDTGNHSNIASLGLLVLRLGVASFMLTHGYGKLLTLFSGEPIQFADPIGIGPAASLILIVFAEFFCSLFLIFGVATRLSAIPPTIGMLVAAFISHGGDPFGRRELPLLYAVVYLTLLLTGGGNFSIDFLISKKFGKRK